MVNWIIIGILVVAIFIFFKVTAFKYEKIWTYVVGAIFVFVLFTFFSVVSHNELDITNFEGFVSGIKFYAQWLLSFATHSATVTGNAINVDWTGNFSNSTT